MYLEHFGHPCCVHVYAPASIVDDLLHNTLNVAVALCEVERTELRRRLVMVGVRLELWVAQRVQLSIALVRYEGRTMA